MGDVLIISEGDQAIKRIIDIVLEHLKQADIELVRPKQVITVRESRPNLVIYVVQPGKEVDLPLIAEIKSFSGKRPLIVYGNLEQIHINMLKLLDMGVSGLLSSNAQNIEHIQAIDAVMRGDSYVDDHVKFQALLNLLTTRRGRD